MLEIWVDLQKEYDILVCARCTANLRRKAKEGQHCFILQDVKHLEELEYLLQKWQTQAHAEKDKGLVPIKVLALSQNHQDFYYSQKIIIKPLSMCTLTGILVAKQFHKLVIALTFTVIHGKLIWTPTRCSRDTSQWVLGRKLTPQQYLCEHTCPGLTETVFA